MESRQVARRRAIKKAKADRKDCARRGGYTPFMDWRIYLIRDLWSSAVRKELSTQK